MLSRNIILTEYDLKDRLTYFLDHPGFVWDVETVGVHRGVPQANQVTWLSMATYGNTFVVPMGHPNGDRMVEKPKRRKDPETKKFVISPARWDEPPKQMRPSTVWGMLEPLFLSKKYFKGAWNTTFDALSSEKYYGEPLVGPFHDGIVQAWLLNENRRLGLKDIVAQRYKRKYDRENVGRQVEIHPFSKVARYGYLDAKFTWLNFLEQAEQIREQDLQHVYDLEMEVLDVLLDMGRAGTLVDVEGMRDLEKILAERVVEIEGRVYKAAGKKFNLNSPKQKVDILYGKKEEGGQGLKPWRLTKGGFKKQKENQPITLYDYSTDSEALEKFKGNKLVDAITDYQEVDRVLGTYVHGYLGVPGDKKKPGQIFDGYVYPDFVQYGTVTGRFSCRSPNLQNLPRPDTELGKAIRSLIIAGLGHKLVVADYGQIELVVLAHFAGRGALWDGFMDGIDPHTMTAALVFGQDPADLQRRVNENDPEAKRMRQAAKAINFAVVYGAGPDKVASMSSSPGHKVSPREAKRFLEKHERQFPEIYRFKDRALKTCKQRNPPHLTTLEGRKRRLPSIWSRDYGIAGKAERQAINSLIQGSSADIIKVAMVRLNKSLKENDCGSLILTVHDELVVRAPDDKVHTAEAVVREAMVGAGIQKMVDVPLSIDLHVVDKWAEAK